MDIDKCYEHVDHGTLIVAAIRHNFPLSMLRLCLKMCRAARTLVWDTTYGNLGFRYQDIGARVFSSSVLVATTNDHPFRCFLNGIPAATML